MSTVEHKISDLDPFTQRRLWSIDEIRIVSKNVGVITYKQHVVNAEKYRIVITLYPWDRWRGVTLEQKIEKAYSKLSSKLKIRNDEILELRRRQQQIIDRCCK